MAGRPLDALREHCAAHGIAPQWHGIDGSVNDVPEATLRALAEAFSINDVPPVPDEGIEQALADSNPPACFVPDALAEARIWGVSCQLGALRSDRNAGVGDFADLVRLGETVARAGGDFVGLNPLHALFWADPARSSPFSPSNRSALNPIYVALDWVDGAELTVEEEAEAARLRTAPHVDLAGVHALKDAVLRRVFAIREMVPPADDPAGRATLGHAQFEAMSRFMVEHGYGAGWMAWPENVQRADCADVIELVAPGAPLWTDVMYHCWLQSETARQLDRVNHEIHEAGLRVGLYLDLAVGVSPDGSATWSDPELSVPGIKIGAPPDPFSDTGQDWGLAPISPTVMAQEKAKPFARMMRAVMRHAGAVRVDHAMALARLFLIPDHSSALDGAYVRYPFTTMLRALAEVSNETRCLVIGEDLGVVPPGFRDVMARRALHAYKVFWFERNEHSFDDPTHWGRDALACVGTHDTATFAGWWTGADLEARHAIGQFDDEGLVRERSAREQDRNAVRRAVGWNEGADWRGEDVRLLSTLVHSRIARAPCRLAVMQLDDVLGATVQPNMPGTTGEHPNWRVKLEKSVDDLAADPGFASHAQVMRTARPSKQNGPR